MSVFFAERLGYDIFCEPVFVPFVLEVGVFKSVAITSVLVFFVDESKALDLFTVSLLLTVF
jgi:hypothetical protein